MRILSFDPGVDTGVAILDEEYNFEIGMTVSLFGWSERLFRLITDLARPDVVLVETPPTFAFNESTGGVYQDIVHWYTVAGYPVEKVNPGQWKGMANRASVSGIHQSDALTMAIWYVRTQRKEEE